MPVYRDLKAEWREIQKLPDSPETRVLIRIDNGFEYYENLTPRGLALRNWYMGLPVPYVATNLLSRGAEPGGKGQEELDALREQMGRAGAFTGDLAVELQEAHAIARQRLGFTELEWQSVTTSELEAHLRHCLLRSSEASKIASPLAAASVNVITDSMAKPAAHHLPHPEDALGDATGGLHSRRVERLMRHIKAAKETGGKFSTQKAFYDHLKINRSDYYRWKGQKKIDSPGIPKRIEEAIDRFPQ